jgi:hypothetical protein
MSPLRWDNSALIFLLAGTMTWPSIIPDSAGIRISSRIGVADFNGDGTLDILVGNLNSINAYDGRTFTRIGGLTPYDPTHLGGLFFS